MWAVARCARSCEPLGSGGLRVLRGAWMVALASEVESWAEAKEQIRVTSKTPRATKSEWAGLLMTAGDAGVGD